MSAESGAAVEAVAASVAALAALAGAAASDDQSCGRRSVAETRDPLRRLADGCLDGLAEVARLEARTAALRVRLAADYAQATRPWRRRRRPRGNAPPRRWPWWPRSPVS